MTAALVRAVFLTVKECNPSPSMSKASEFVSVMKPSLLIYGKILFSPDTAAGLTLSACNLAVAKAGGTSLR